MRSTLREAKTTYMTQDGQEGDMRRGLDDEDAGTGAVFRQWKEGKAQRQEKAKHV